MNHNVHSSKFIDQSTKAQSIEEAVELARSAFSNYIGLVHIRAGWKFKDGWITDQEAIVFSVDEVKSRDELAAIGLYPIPKFFAGYPTETKAASPFDIVDELKNEWLTEASIRQGTYQRSAAEFPLDSVSDEMKVEIHVGPDAGSDMLVNFIENTKQSLTVGMYEFSAPHLVDRFNDILKDEGKLSMVLQKGGHIGSGTKAEDIPDEETVKILQNSLGDRMDFAWASIGQRKIFPWAYHIKLAVRDNDSIWLSSGSWQSSNQPPFNTQVPGISNDRLFLPDKYNREWHVTIENEKLAKQFEAHLLQDLKEAKEVEEGAEKDDPVIWIETAAHPRVDKEVVENRYFPALNLKRKVQVQPLLTPDNFPTQLLHLIEGAKKSILFQNQSFNIAKNRDDRFVALLDVLLKKQRTLEDVRIIVRGEFAREQIEKMKTYGFDTSKGKVKLQDRCHAKTVIIDGKIVLIGSHNFTDSGTTANRDASVVFYDQEIAEYCSAVFEYDWRRCRNVIHNPRRGATFLREEVSGFTGMGPLKISEIGLL